MITSTDELMCKLACQDLVYLFAKYRDKPHECSIDEVLSEDAELLGSGVAMRGPEVRQRMESGAKYPFNLIHIFTNVVITQTGPDSARGCGYLLEYTVRKSADEALPQPMPDKPRLVGDRLFEFRRTEAGWRMTRYQMSPVLSEQAHH